MRSLLDPLPEVVEIEGHAYPIQTDFRAGIRFELEALEEEPNAETLLQQYYPAGIPPNTALAVEKMLWFYRCGVTSEQEKEERSGTKAVRAYEFDQDADALFTSFWEAYGIDLNTAALHWWKFRALMFGLPPDSKFMQLVYFRTADTTGASKEQRQHLARMKKLYQLKGSGNRESLLERDTNMKGYVARRFAEAEACRDGKN